MRLLSDEPARVDYLQRANVARTLAELAYASPADQPFAIGLEGPWGSGKTSLLNLVRASFTELIEQPATTHTWFILEFNPWLVGSANTLAIELLREIALKVASVSVAGESRNKIARKLVAYATLLQHLKNIPEVSGWLDTALPGAGLVARTVAAISNRFKTERQRLEELGSPAELRAALSALLSESRIRGLVIVDDLDRLSGKEILETLTALKAVASFAGIVYAVAYDRDVVARAYTSERAQDGDSSARRVAVSYLEKIFQLQVPVPLATPYQRLRLLRQRFPILKTQLEVSAAENALRKDGSSLEDTALELTASLLRHPRDITRLENRLRFVRGLMPDVNIYDMCVWEAACLRDHSLAALALSQPYLFSRLEWSTDSDFPAQNLAREVREHYENKKEKKANPLLAGALLPELGPARETVLEFLFAIIDVSHRTPDHPHALNRFTNSRVFFRMLSLSGYVPSISPRDLARLLEDTVFVQRLLNERKDDPHLMQDLQNSVYQAIELKVGTLSAEVLRAFANPSALGHDDNFVAALVNALEQDQKAVGIDYLVREGDLVVISRFFEIDLKSMPREELLALRKSFTDAHWTALDERILKAIENEAIWELPRAVYIVLQWLRRGNASGKRAALHKAVTEHQAARDYLAKGFGSQYSFTENKSELNWISEFFPDKQSLLDFLNSTGHEKLAQLTEDANITDAIGAMYTARQAMADSERNK